MDFIEEYAKMMGRLVFNVCNHEKTETKPSGEYCYHPFLGEIEGTVKVCTKCGKEVK